MIDETCRHWIDDEDFGKCGAYSCLVDCGKCRLRQVSEMVDEALKLKDSPVRDDIIKCIEAQASIAYILMTYWDGMKESDTLSARLGYEIIDNFRYDNKWEEEEDD